MYMYVTCTGAGNGAEQMMDLGVALHSVYIRTSLCQDVKLHKHDVYGMQHYA